MILNEKQLLMTTVNQASTIVAYSKNITVNYGTGTLTFTKTEKEGWSYVWNSILDNDSTEATHLPSHYVIERLEQACLSNRQVSYILTNP